MTWDVVVGDCRESLQAMPEKSVQTCVTSPPYFGLRDYGTGEWEGGDPSCEHRVREDSRVESSTLGGGKATTGHSREGFKETCPRCGARRVDRQIGLEPTPDEFVQALVAVFREVRRVLRDDGTVWLNLGDSYAAVNRGENATPRGDTKYAPQMQGTHFHADIPTDRRRIEAQKRDGVKPKDLLGIPWMVAFALRADGWYLRSDIIWAKPNPMPESVTDRPTKAHEYLFLLSKGPRYFYDADAIREPHTDPKVVDGAFTGTGGVNRNGYEPHTQGFGKADGSTGGVVMRDREYNPAGRNRRSVWTVATQPFPGAHFATFPPKLIEPCILAGTSPKACGACGAPWRRVVERKPMVVRPSEKRANWQAEDDHARTQTGGTMLEPPEARTTGWEPSCAHHDPTGTSIVLDPFAGSGTVGVVCGWHGRDFIGCELNPEYARMARERIALEGRPGGRPNGHEAAREIVGQLGLLG